jgi:hypothetical protein
MPADLSSATMPDMLIKPLWMTARLFHLPGWMCLSVMEILL